MDEGASTTAGDVFEVPPGHDAWVVGDEPWISIDFAGRRLFAKSPAEASERKFATIVFTDLIASTETLARMGDSALACASGRAQPGRAEQIERFSGREVKTTGDGFLVMFDNPARAVRGAAAMLDTAGEGLMARAGVHTGEVELQGDDVRGIAVHAAARILGSPSPGRCSCPAPCATPRRIRPRIHRPG